MVRGDKNGGCIVVGCIMRGYIMGVYRGIY